MQTWLWSVHQKNRKVLTLGERIPVINLSINKESARKITEKFKVGKTLVQADLLKQWEHGAS